MDMFLKQDELAVEQYASRKAMGEAAAKEVAAKIAGLQREKESVNIIFAAAPSQNEFLEALIAAPGIDWRRVNGFHMDEYIGLAGIRQFPAWAAVWPFAVRAGFLPRRTGG